MNLRCLVRLGLSLWFFLFRQSSWLRQEFLSAGCCFGQIAAWIFLPQAPCQCLSAPNLSLSLLHLPLPCTTTLQPCSSLPSHAAPGDWWAPKTPHICVSALVPSCPGWSPPMRCGSCRWMKARPAPCPAPAAHPLSTADASPAWRAWHLRGCDPARRAHTKQTGCDTAAERSSFSSLTPHRYILMP